jgi:hypothetical protein
MRGGSGGRAFARCASGGEAEEPTGIGSDGG